jgi:hypothetical protein
MSASWDPDREGDLIGTEEFQTNLNNIKDGLRRSRENVLLREKMAGLGDDQLKVALTDLERRDAVESKRKESLENKLNNELD